MFGVLNLCKPLHCTSHDMVQQLRRLFGLKRVGHLGTLDPLAEGVLPICLGKATRLIEYFPSDKCYQATVCFGMTTHTLDREGEVVSRTNASHLTPEALQAILPEFTGTIQQQVPLHSAVHVDGKKLYRYAQQGHTVTPPSKTVEIYHLSMVPDSFYLDGETAHCKLTVHCASGTYIRSLARDLGERLGVGAYLTGLVRTRHGAFSLETAVALDTLKATDHPSQYLQDPIPYLGLPVVSFPNPESFLPLIQGMKLSYTPEWGKIARNQFAVARFEQNPVAVIARDGEQIKPVKVFYEPGVPVS